MKATPASQNPWLRRLKSKPAIAIGALLLLALILAIIFRPAKVDTSGSFYTASRGDFLISIVEGGNIQSVNEVNIRSEVEGSARIIYIVPEGSYVEKDDLLVELDSAAAQDEVNQQLIAVEKAEYAYIAAEKTLAIQRSIAESEIRTAELKLEFAEKDLQKFIEGQAEQELTQAENEVASFKEKLAMDEERLTWSRKLYEKGFETKSNLDRDQLTHFQTELSLQMATNALWLLQTYDHPKQRRQFESNVEEAKAELQRVKDQAESKIAQYEADLRTQEITLKLSKDRLKRYEDQLAASKIYAPQDGLVVYAVNDNRFSSESLIEEGATVRNRQTLIKLPDTSAMKLSVKIHESHINMIQPGLPAFVVLDSMPDRRFRGVVQKVGLLPDTTSRWGNPNLKEYATEIYIQDPIPDVKPGVSASAEIIVTNLKNVVTVPIQAVATRKGQPVVYLADSGKPTPVPVEVGLYNTRFIEIVSGVQPGDRVLLAPPFDTQDRDLGGGIISEDEAATNEFTTTGPIPGIDGPAMARAGAGGEGRPGMEGAPGGGERRRGDNREEGQRPAVEANGGFPSDGPRMVPEAGAAGGEGGRQRGGAEGRAMFQQMQAQYDKDGDGELNDEEREAMRAAMRERFGQGGGRPRDGAAPAGAGGEPSGGGERSFRGRPGNAE